MTNRSLAGLRVLVVAEEYALADDIKTVLIEAGAERVRLSGEVTDAMRQIGQDSFAFALVDSRLRGTPTLPLADMLLRSGLPFGFLTGPGQGDLPTRFSGVPRWRKPANPQALVLDIARLCLNGTGAPPEPARQPEPWSPAGP